MIRYCVLGSLNMDLITRVERFPRPGQTIPGMAFQMSPGGKGANQAVALARLGASVSLAGAVGDDEMGRSYLAVLDREGVDRSQVGIVPKVPTGTASIWVENRGENQIVVVPGANGQVSVSTLPPWDTLLEGVSFLLLQLEIPMETIVEAACQARRRGITVILDPAPARTLPHELLPFVDVVTPNETEAAALTGCDTSTESGISRACAVLMTEGARSVIVKAGARGAFLATPGKFLRIPGFPVDVVDTVAAGDSFNAGLAFSLGHGKPMEDSVRFANAVAGLATTKSGAQTAMPSLEEVSALMSKSEKFVGKE